ncbi:unnamed protein product, partial [Mesorhabditis spiculigera]
MIAAADRSPERGKPAAPLIQTDGGLLRAEDGLMVIPHRPVPQCMLPIMKGTKEKDRKPFASVGTIIDDRWEVKGLIGQGGYGEVYYAVDKKTNAEVAVKVEAKHHRGKLDLRVLLEQKVLMLMQGRPHVSKVYASGVTGPTMQHHNFIVLQLLSQNLGDLQKQSPLRRLSQSTVARIGIQGIAALRDMHNAGYLHRDVKPKNMCFGVTPYSLYRLFLVDFGMVRRHMNPGGKLREPRPLAGFRGTVRYASRRIHDGREACPADDLIALMYSLLELLVITLPWKYLNADKWRTSDMSLHYPIVGRHFQAFARIVQTYGISDIPGYESLQAILRPMCHGKQLWDEYDWEDGYIDLLRH